MWYVYSRSLISGREEFVGIYNTDREAVAKISQCYSIDKNTCQKNQYYYFMKRH